jgi:hypothetical protein
MEDHEHGPDCGCAGPLFGLGVALALIIGGAGLWWILARLW